MIAEWDVLFDLVTPIGTLPINQPLDTTSDRRFQLNPARCTGFLPVRLTEDDIPQGDGKIPHRRWRSGYQIHLALEALVGTPPDLEPACGADLVAMLDLLGWHLNEIIRTGLVPGAPNARLIWAPSGTSDDRMLDRAQLASGPIHNFDGVLGGSQVEVDIDSSFPYYIAKTENQKQIGTGGSGGTETINNPGNTDYYPTVRVQGPASTFDIVNHDVVDLDGNPLQLTYDTALPGSAGIGSGDYVEIDFFRQTAYLNGNQANLKSGIDFRVSDFFPLAPGDNDIELVGADALVLSNGAWA